MCVASSVWKAECGICWHLEPWIMNARRCDSVSLKDCFISFAKDSLLRKIFLILKPRLDGFDLNIPGSGAFSLEQLVSVTTLKKQLRT